MREPFQLGAYEIARQTREGALRPEDVVSFYAKRTEDLHAVCNAHTFWDKDAALNDAEKQIDYIQAARYAQKSLPLAGVPIAIKDNIMVEGQWVTCGSKFLRNHRAAYDATVIQKLRSAGALLFGRTNMDEFAMGSSNENSSYGPVLNPWNRRHVAGGSSGGSAAVVAADMAPLALGSDTGGSIRQPASFCGVYGLKPSYGAVSRYGLVAYASSLDQIGPFARDVRDLALLYDVLAGPDGLDSTSHRATLPPCAPALVSGSLRGIRIGLVRDFLGEGLQAEVRSSFLDALACYQDLGAELVEVDLPLMKASIPVYYIIATAEASANLARFDGVRYGVRANKPGQSLRELYIESRSEGFGREVKQRIMLGTYVLSAGYYEAYYGKAARIRELMKREIEAVFSSGVHMIATPTAPTTAFELGQKTQDSLAMYLGDIYTIAANLAGIPALSHPIGFDTKGLPIGLQLMAPAFHEATLLRSAYQYEQQNQQQLDKRPRL